MYQGTTPAIVFNVLGYDLSSATVFVSFEQKKDILTKSGTQVSVAYDDDENYSSVICSLTQEETLALKRGSVMAQIRFIYANGQAYATNKAPITVEEVIFKEVIHYGGGV